MDRYPPGSRRTCLRLLLGAGAAAFATAAGASDKPAGSGEKRGVFFDIERIVVSVFRGPDVERYDMILMKLELEDDTVIVPVQQAMPRLRDAFVRSWNALGALPEAADRPLDVATGRKRMLAAADQIVGPGRVRNVLIVAQSSRYVGQRRR